LSGRSAINSVINGHVNHLPFFDLTSIAITNAALALSANHAPMLSPRPRVSSEVLLSMPWKNAVNEKEKYCHDEVQHHIQHRKYRRGDSPARRARQEAKELCGISALSPAATQAFTNWLRCWSGRDDLAKSLQLWRDQLLPRYRFYLDSSSLFRNFHVHVRLRLTTLNGRFCAGLREFICGPENG